MITYGAIGLSDYRQDTVGIGGNYMPLFCFHELKLKSIY